MKIYRRNYDEKRYQHFSSMHGLAGNPPKNTKYWAAFEWQN